MWFASYATVMQPPSLLVVSNRPISYCGSSLFPGFCHGLIPPFHLPHACRGIVLFLWDDDGSQFRLLASVLCLLSSALCHLSSVICPGLISTSHLPNFPTSFPRLCPLLASLPACWLSRFPASELPGLPACWLSLFPASRPPGLPASRPPGLPASQPPSLPASQLPSLPASQPPSFPASQPPSFPAS